MVDKDLYFLQFESTFVFLSVYKFLSIFLLKKKGYKFFKIQQNLSKALNSIQNTKLIDCQICDNLKKI